MVVFPVMEPPPIISVAGDRILKLTVPQDQTGALQEEPVVIIVQVSDQTRDITVVATPHSLIQEAPDLQIIVVAVVVSQAEAEVVVALAEVLPQA